MLGSFEEIPLGTTEEAVGDWSPAGWAGDSQSGVLGSGSASLTHQLSTSLGRPRTHTLGLFCLTYKAWMLTGLAFLPHQISGGSNEVIHLRMFYKETFKSYVIAQNN